MKKTLLLLLAMLMLAPLFTMSAFAAAQSFIVYEIPNCYFITSPYKWDSPELKELVDTIEAMTESTADHKNYYMPLRVISPSMAEPDYEELIIDGVTNYRYNILTYQPDGIEKDLFHRQMYKALMAFEQILLECKIEIANPDNVNEQYLSKLLIITSNYGIDDAQLQELLSALPEHKLEKNDYFTIPESDSYTNAYLLRFIGDYDTFFQDYAYLKKAKGINIYLEVGIKPAMLGEHYNGFYPETGDVDGSAKVNAMDASLILRYDVALLDFPISLQIADVNRDGEVTAMDAALVLQYDVGLIESF